MTKKKMVVASVFILQMVVMMAVMFLVLNLAYAQHEKPQAAAGASESAGWGFIGAALAVGLACIGSGYAVSKIGSSGIGAVTEKPELMGKTLVFLGLAEGIAIYGLIIAVMILNKF
jgi:V/A-type H+/Na+-transporting ATPase subunit K